MAISICCNFPRKLVFALKKYMGLSLKHLNRRKIVIVMGNAIAVSNGTFTLAFGTAA
jgi:hypothetical protein